jgi:threonine dehydratase
MVARDRVTATEGQPVVGLADIEAAHAAIAGVVAQTPVFTSRWLSGRAGRRVVLKAENLQRTGSFKIRGAANKLAALTAEGGGGAKAGIVVASAGNHAQAAALAAREAGVSCEVFMPVDASVGKTEATLSYGATVNLVGDSIDQSLVAARARADETGSVFVHPFDDPTVIAGAGTLGLELLEQIPDLTQVIIPIGGGGLASGVAIALKARLPGLSVVGVQASSCAPFPASIAAHSPVTLAGGVVTLADGIAVKRPGDLTLPLIERFVDEVVTVSENEIADAMVLLIERAKLVVEGAGAVGVAALLAGRVPEAGSGTTAVVLSGGNVDTGLLTPAIRRHETNAGRRLVLFSRVSDRPGELARLLVCIGSAGANVVAVEHLRDGFDLHVRETGLHLTLETRNREHAQAVIDAAHAQGYDAYQVGTERDD